MAMAERTPWILLLLLQGEGRQRYNKPVVGRTRLMKELFLLKETYGLRQIGYEFIPYWYGPFCPEVLADLQDLRSEGLLTAQDSPSGEIFSLTPPGVRRAQGAAAGVLPDVIRRIRECKERYNSMPFEDLIAYVYERWPRYTARALRSPAAALEELRKQARKARITEADVDRAIAESRAQTP